MNEYYKGKLEKGLEFQDYVVERMYEFGFPITGYSSKSYQYSHGENRNGVEIKYDMRMAETGNLYIEVAEKSDASREKFWPSGILRNDNSWLWAIGDYKVIYVFAKRQLRWIYETESPHVVVISTSKGFLLPVSRAEKGLAVAIIREVIT